MAPPLLYDAGIIGFCAYQNALTYCFLEMFFKCNPALSDAGTYLSGLMTIVLCSKVVTVPVVACICSVHLFWYQECLEHRGANVLRPLRKLSSAQYPPASKKSSCHEVLYQFLKSFETRIPFLDGKVQFKLGSNSDRGITYIPSKYIRHRLFDVEFRNRLTVTLTHSPKDNRSICPACRTQSTS